MFYIQRHRERKWKILLLKGKPDITKQDTCEVLRRVGKVKWFG